MNAREQWQALQAWLTAARTSWERGDRDRALAEIEAALAIDPSFLAAIVLRERIAGSEVPGTEVAGFGFRVQNLENPENPENPENLENPENPTNPLPATRYSLPDPPLPVVEPLVSAAGYARFEQRARRRRVDRKIDAARRAMTRRNLRGAASALDEVIELDPNLPELSELTATFDDLRRSRATSHRLPVTAAVVAFGAALFGVTSFHQDRVLESYPATDIAELVDAPNPVPLGLPAVGAPEETAPDAVIATTGIAEVVPPPRTSVVDEPPRVSAAVSRTPLSPLPAPPSQPPAPPPSSSTPPPAMAPAPAIIPPVTQAVALSPLPSPVAPLPAPTTATPVPAGANATPVDVPKPPLPSPSRAEIDEAQITRALLQYRSAYDGLDAKRARDIWPAVNEAALARAFGSLASQRLTFDACRTQLNGDAAVTTCQGTARYVTKVGSREPRVEPRTWTFIMRKAGGDWKIETARAER